MTKKKFSKDPKVELISLEEFLKSSNYLFDARENYWEECNKPECGVYYKITPKMLICISYVLTFINFGMDASEKLDSIKVAYRDGKTEYELFDNKIKKLLANKKHKISKSIDQEIKNVKVGLEFLRTVDYLEISSVEEKKFEDYLINVDYKTSLEQLKGQYVVFDVETNGTRKSNDDLLSISIYDPTNGKGYNRYLPLELQPLILTGWVNGITDEKLNNATHITQEELDKVIEYFDLKNKTLLSFSGGQGTFDSSFIINYCKRHNLVGFENLKYENIKSLFPDAEYGLEGQMTKDNLCRLLKIDGVKKIHSSMNDCLLEWKLFERIKTEPLFFIDKYMFKYHEGYIVPVSYLNRHPELVTFANINVPYIIGKAKKLFEFSLPKKTLRQIKKFPTNITGISLENGINSFFNVEKQDNFKFLAENKRHLEYIGSLDSRIIEIPVETQEDGTMKSLDQQHDVYIEEVNKVTKVIINCLTPVFDFIKKQIFTTNRIMSQELSISSDGKVLALCDLSNEESVLEIKTFSVSGEDGLISDSLAKQLYYESRGRKTFALSINFDQHLNKKCELITDAVNVRIYQIGLEKSKPKPIKRVRILVDDEIEILNIIKDNPLISNADIARHIKRSPNSVGIMIKNLVFFKYLKKEDGSKRNSRWIILRNSDDIITRYSLFNGEITLLFDNEEKQYVF